MLLATFTQKVEEIDLLVEPGDRVTLRGVQYQPFLTDPRVDRVIKPEAASLPPSTSTSSTSTPATTTAAPE